MSGTSPPPGTPSPGSPAAGAPSPGAEPRTSDRFFAWLRSLGITRSSDRWLAGVAGGVAEQARIDPLIVRGVFVVLALLGGPGILLYLAGWILLPDRTGRLHAEEVIRGRASTGTIVAAVLLGVCVVLPLTGSLLSAVFGGWIFSDAWGFISPPGWLQVTLGVIWYALVLPALIVGLILWLTHLRRQRGDASARPTWSGEGERSTPDAGSTSGDDIPTDAHADGQRWNERQNEWRAQFDEHSRRVREESKAWSEFGQQYHQHRSIGAAHVVLTLSLALLAAGVASGWALSLSLHTDLILTAGLLAAVGTLAVSLIIAGIRGRHSNWVGFLTFVGVLALIFAPFTHVLPDNIRVVPIGSTNERVHASDPAASALVNLVGSTVLDLSDLRVGSGPREIEVWQVVGSSTIELPASLPAEVHVVIVGGTLRGDASGAGQSGLFVGETIGSRSSASSVETITVRVRTLFGTVRVEGGDQPQVEPQRDATRDETEVAR